MRAEGFDFLLTFALEMTGHGIMPSIRCGSCWIPYQAN
jgi:hypothetical protein